MRVVEPRRHTDTKARNKKSGKWRAVALAILALAALFYLLPERVLSPEEASDTDVATSQAQDQLSGGDQLPAGEWRQFSGNEFRIFYDQLLQPGLDKVDLPPSITGNETADTRIRQLAETRGYRLRSSPTNALSYVNGHPVQTPVVESWLTLKRAAASVGLNMTVTSGYRSVESQRQLFVSRVLAEGVSVAEIANGMANEAIIEVLRTTAVPGYSKHHTGYTVDILCAGWQFEKFADSACHDWLSADNYLKAKEHGFIPSYPEGADLQGPDPEAWEYVWVGNELLRNQTEAESSQ